MIIKLPNRPEDRPGEHISKKERKPDACHAGAAKERFAGPTIPLDGAHARVATLAGDPNQVTGQPLQLVGDRVLFLQVDRHCATKILAVCTTVHLLRREGVLEVGVVDPDNIEALDALQFISGKIGIPYKIFLITKQDFDRVIDAYQNLSGEVGRALSEYETAAKPSAESQEAEGSGEESLNLAGPHETLKEDAPVTKIVSTILRYAIEGHSSDIHIEPEEDKVLVRYRIDGLLRDKST